MGSTLWADPAGPNNLMGSSCVLGPVFDFTVPGVLPAGATLTRSGVGATHIDNTGSLVEDAADVARWTYDPSTLALQGVWNEELRTNSDRNPRLEGSVAGTPGTPPTFTGSSGTLNGLARTIVGAGAENGAPYLDLKYAGTTSGSAAGSGMFNFESTTQIDASPGQTWTASLNAYVVAGGLANVSLFLGMIEADASGAVLAGTPSSAITAVSGSLASRRYSATRLFNSGTTAKAFSRLQYSASAGAAINFTLRMGLPQIELGTGASSIILPPVGAPAAQTRNADVLSLALANGTYNIDIFRASGLTSLTNVVVSGGSYTVPTDLSPLRLVIPKRIA